MSVTPPGVSLASRLGQVGALLRDVRDIVDERVARAVPPAWCQARGWERFLEGLDEEALARCEREGMERVAGALPGAPPDLVALAAAITRATAWREVAASPAEVRALRRASARKRQQVAALVDLCRTSLPRPTRVVDVGAGLGHLTRELARALEVPSVGLERDPARVLAARALTGPQGPGFEAREVGPELRFAPGDLAVGLHACGALGDALVAAAARDGASLLLVCCCLQKVPAGARAPLSRAGQAAGLLLRREVLGLTNLVPRRVGVEGPLERTLEARAVRHALRLLLASRGVEVEPGAEMRGLHRRHVQRGLGALAERALARRGLAPATAAELEAAGARAEVEYARIRRYSLPRAMLGRLLEQAVVLDRACALEEAGLPAEVVPVFPLDLSPRNLAVVARGR